MVGSMIKRLVLLVFVGFLVSAPATARSGALKMSNHERSVRQAVSMLGTDTWAQVIRIKNRRPGGAYRREVWASVFEFNDILWFYTPAEGTQSLSLYRGKTEEDKANLLPLLQAVHSGFVGFDVPQQPDSKNEGNSYPKLDNGCFVESLHALGTLVAAGEFVTDARLLLYYSEDRGRVVGHTGLYASTAGGQLFWDPEHPEDWRRITIETEGKAMSVARKVAVARMRSGLKSARWLPVDRIGSRRSELLAAVSPGPAESAAMEGR